MTHPSRNGLAPAEGYQVLATTASRFLAGTILHWAAYTWHWCMHITLYEGDHSVLTTWPWPITIASDYGLSPVRRQAIIWINAAILSTKLKGTYFSEIISKIQKFSLKKMPLNKSSEKWRPFFLGLNVLSKFSTSGMISWQLVFNPWCLVCNAWVLFQ